MKRAIFGLMLILLCAFPLRAVEEKEPRNGYWWNSFDEYSEAVEDAVKLGYVAGLAEGLGRACDVFDKELHRFLWEDSLSENDPWMFIGWCANYFDAQRNRLTGITYGQMVDGLDELYRDYRNKGLLVIDAMQPVKMEVEGRPEAEIDSVTRYLRRTSP
jgi:hypothetical protein